MWRATVMAAAIAAVAWIGTAVQTSRFSKAATEETSEPESVTASDVKSGTPVVTMETTTANVGEIPAGKTISFDFIITNTGKSQLEITAKPRCGCTVVDYDKRIGPGRQGRLKTELRTSHLRGKFEKFVDVQTNDPERQSIRLGLAGLAVEAVEVTPSRNPSAILAMKGPTVLEVGLKTIEQVQVTKATSGVSYAQIQLIPNGDRTYRLMITIQPEAPWGRSNFVLMLSTTAEYQREIPLTVYHEKGIIVTPNTLPLTAARPGDAQPATGSVLLRKSTGKFAVLKAASSDPDVDVTFVALKPGTLYRLTATCRSNGTPIDAPATISVETDAPDQPTLEIPVRRTRQLGKTRRPTRSSQPAPPL